MSHLIIKRITITSDLRVMVRMAANNIRPLDFRYGEIESLTETLRTKGRPTLDLELLSLFFKGCWQPGLHGGISGGRRPVPERAGDPLRQACGPEREFTIHGMEQTKHQGPAAGGLRRRGVLL